MASQCTPTAVQPESRGGFYTTPETLLKDVEEKVRRFVNSNKSCDYLYGYCESGETTKIHLILDSSLKNKGLIFTNLKEEDAALAAKVASIADKHGLTAFKTIYNVEYNTVKFTASKLSTPQAFACVNGMICMIDSLLTVIEADENSDLALSKNLKLVKQLQENSEMFWQALIAQAGK